MRALLSLLLSFCIVLSSISPSFAQAARGGRAVIKGLTRPVAPTSLHSQVSRMAQLQRPASVLQIRALMSSGVRAGVAARILTVPSLPERALLLRNEFVTLTLEKHVLPEQLGKAVSFYRTDLASSSEAFASFAGKDFSSSLAAAQDPASSAFADFFACRAALADAAALGLFGSKADVQKLVAFYEKAKGSAFEDVAAAITARGMLRQGAYEELTAWAKDNASDNFFWSELAAYTEANGLPVELSVARGAQAQVPSAGMREFLRQGLESNALNADFSRAATEEWMALGTRPAAAKPVAAPEQAPAAVAAPKLTASLADVKLPAADLTLSPVELTGAVPAISAEAPAAVKTQGAAEGGNKPAVSSSSNSGILYCGLPVFEMAKLAQKGYRALSKLFSRKKAARVNVPEEPGLHENTVRPVYEARRVSTGVETDSWINAGPSAVPAEVAEDGFKLTVEDEAGVESILKNVDIAIDSSIKTAGYNRVVLNKDHVFELRNLELAPGQMDHFFFEMPNANGELFRLGEGAKALNMPRPLRIKLEKAPNRRYEVRTLQLYHEGSSSAYMMATVDASLLPSGAEGHLLADANGGVWFVETSGKRTLLKDYYLRLPKEDSKYWTKIMQADGKPFSLQVHSTSNKTSLLTMAVPSLQIGLGKTTAPELSSRTNLGESASSMIMLGINNVLPIMMGFVHPLLKRYGEAVVARWGMGFFVAGGLTALFSGLYGGLGEASMTDLQTLGFILSSVLIATGTNITRFVQNILISANRGKIVPTDSFKKKAVKPGMATEVPNMSYLMKRAKEVAKFQKGAVRDGALFQTASMFKNIGTMAFLAYPWLVNQTSEWLFGVNPGLDFSASYVPYTLWAGLSAWKLSKTAYKDAFPMNLAVVENQFKESLAQIFDGMAAMPAENLLASSKEMTSLAKKLNGMIDSLTAVEVRNKKGDGKKLTAQHEAEAVDALQKSLLAQGMPAELAEQTGQELQKAFDALGHRNVKLMDVLKLEHLTPGIIGMALATMHELSVSNGFAFAMHEVVGEGTFANALTALTLYGSMSGGRILGNIISRYLSGGSMYALSSAFSIGGTAMMATAGDSISQLMTGAVIASFGVGNFFSQMYEYMTGLYPQYKREISLLINYTMPVAAVLSFPMRWLVNVTGISGLDLMLAGGAVAASVALTPGMLANSTVVQVAKYEGGRLWQKVKNLFKRGGNNTPGNLDNAAPAN